MAGTSSDRFDRYTAFFPYYLSEHRDPVCRRLHYVGTTLEIVWVVTAIVTLNPWFLLAAAFSGYGFAWIGHFFFERNKPATFKYPLWSYIADHQMAWLAVMGKLPRHLEKLDA